MTKRAKCDECGGPLMQVLVGMPGGDAFEAADRGEVLLWGCIVEPNIPLAACGCGETIVQRFDGSDDEWDGFDDDDQQADARPSNRATEHE
jgi:hypothetical protein